jgi:hypothetical protein
MRPLFKSWVLTLGSMAVLVGAAQADVFVRGPFGGRIVVSSPPDVIVGPPGVVVVPAPPPPVVVMPAPQPIVMTNAILPQDFVRTVPPRPGTYTVTFVHPRTSQPVTVSFTLPPGNPRVSYAANSLVFDYGRSEVEIRFQIMGKVKVIQR